MTQLTFKQFIILSRPVLFPILILCLFVALFFSANLEQINIFHILQILFISFLSPFVIFAINDFYDYDTDKINERKKDIIQGKTFKNIKDLKDTIIKYDIIIILFILLFSLIFKNIIHTLSLAFLFFFIYYYSAPPIRFKEIPFFDSISNGIIVLLYFVSIYSLFNSINNLPVEVLVTAIAIMSYHLIAAELDRESDKKANQITTATFINNKNITYLLAILYNVPLLFVNFSSAFSYLFYVNIFLIILSYLLQEKTNNVKRKLLIFFLLSWGIITLIYILVKLFL